MVLQFTKSDFELGLVVMDVNSEYSVLFVPVDESVDSDYGKFSLARLNIVAAAVIDGKEVYKPCPNIIGLRNELVSIVSTAPQYEGEMTTLDNLDHFMVELYEQR